MDRYLQKRFPRNPFPVFIRVFIGNRMSPYVPHLSCTLSEIGGSGSTPTPTRSQDSTNSTKPLTSCRRWRGEDVSAHHEDLDEWQEVLYRDSLWTDAGRVTGDVSALEDWYHIIQYDEVLETVGDTVHQHQDDMGVEVSGTVSLPPTAHKMSSKVDFHGDPTVYAAEDDPITLGLKVRSGHSGFHGLRRTPCEIRAFHLARDFCQDVILFAI